MSWENWAVAIGLGALLMMFFVLMELFFCDQAISDGPFASEIREWRSDSWRLTAGALIQAGPQSRKHDLCHRFEFGFRLRWNAGKSNPKIFAFGPAYCAPAD